MFVVGLTGGIGSGKSTVARHFTDLGVEIVDADLIAREVVEPGQPALRDIAEHFGHQILNSEGGLDRAALREQVFDNPQQRKWLEELLHPLIRDLTLARLESARSAYCLLVSPLLLETDQHLLVDHILVVDVPEATQISRTVSRDDNSEQQVRAILKAQCSRAERLERADSTIDNSGDPGLLAPQVQALHKEFSRLASSDQP